MAPKKVDKLITLKVDKLITLWRPKGGQTNNEISEGVSFWPAKEGILLELSGSE